MTPKKIIVKPSGNIPLKTQIDVITFYLFLKGN